MSLWRLLSAACCLLACLGCRSADPLSGRLPSNQIESAVLDLLEEYDREYDAEHQMIRIEFRTPGYHSRFPAGRPAHPTRESLVYALALLQRDAEGDAGRAAFIVGRVLALQDTDPDSPTCGVWPWLMEEPLDEMAAPDFNWADFCGAQIAHMLVEHGERLPGGLRVAMRRSLKLAAHSIRRRNVGPGYTNIAVLGGGVCAVAGEVLDDPALLDYGRRRLENVVAHTARHGSFNEYNSPPYAIVVIAECERMLQLVRDPRVRAAAESLRRTAWRIAAESFHPGTQQWAGPHARNSRDRLRAGTAAFLARRTGVDLRPHPSMADDTPRGHEVVRPLPCPEDLVGMFRQTIDGPRQIRRTFVRGRSEAESIVGTTWSSADACLGSVSRSSLWTQRKPLIGYWKTGDDPAVVFRLRFLRDGRDFASMGVRTVQEGPRALSLFQALPGRGDWHRTLDRPVDGIFRAADFRVRYELRGVGARADALGGGRYALAAGERQVVVHTLPGRFDGQDVVWEVGWDDESVFLDGICHHGDARRFDFSSPVEVVLAAGIELLDFGAAPADSSPMSKQIPSGGIEVTWESPEKGMKLFRNR